MEEQTMNDEQRLKAIRREIRNKQERLRRTLLRINDPAYLERERKQSREYYAKHRKQEIANSAKWNRENKEKRNATRRKLYAKNKDKINAKRKQQRLAKANHRKFKKELSKISLELS